MSLDCITIIHRLEQVSSDEHVGSLAENLLEALRTNEAAASRIEEVRGQTKAEKKRLAMAMREKQLGALGMRTNDKGQVCFYNLLRKVFFSSPKLMKFILLKFLGLYLGKQE